MSIIHKWFGKNDPPDKCPECGGEIVETEEYKYGARILEEYRLFLCTNCRHKFYMAKKNIRL